MLITNFLAKKSHAIFETVVVEAYIGRKIYKYSEYMKYLVNSVNSLVINCYTY